MSSRATDSFGTRGNPSLEFHDHSGARAPVVEFQVAQRQSQDGQVLKGVEVAKVAPHPDVIAEESDQTPADVPSKIVVPELLDSIVPRNRSGPFKPPRPSSSFLFP